MGGFYLLILSLILSIPLSISAIENTHVYFSQFTDSSVKEMPTLIVKRGKLSLSPEHRIELKKKSPDLIWVGLDKNNQTFLMVDLSDKVDSLRAVQVPVLITKDTIRIQVKPFFGTGKMTSNLIHLPPYLDGTLGPTELLHLIKQTETNMIYMVFPIIVSTVWGTSVVALCFLAFFGQFMSFAIMRYKIKFIDTVRLMSVAATPSVVFFALFYNFNLLTNLYVDAIIIFLFVSYYLFGIRACRLEKEFSGELVA